MTAGAPTTMLRVGRMLRSRVRNRALGAILMVAAALLVAAIATGQFAGSPNDLFALNQGFGQEPDKVPVQLSADIPTLPVPRAHCAPGSRLEPGIQGRIPAGSAADGLDCNVTLVSHEGTNGGFKVFRYVDAAGHVCAFYDTTLLFPLNAINPAGTAPGVAVLDMSNPAKPVRTDLLIAPPMLSPHESLNLNPTRGLLAAVNGSPETAPGDVATYDARSDCRHPVLQSTFPVGRLGHESGFALDGKTFYATSTGTPGITAVDETRPADPRAIWQGQIISHGMTLSDDGNRAFIAVPAAFDPKTGYSPGGDMLILDTSEIQARKPNPQAREISRVTWPLGSIPQNAIPFTRHGHPYVLEFDEYSARSRGADPDAVGAARIIDIVDEHKPRVISNIRLQVNQPAEHAEAAGDPGAFSPTQGYGAHYCNIPTRVEPLVVACSFILSGLRVFDISHLRAPKEIAYFVAPTKAAIYSGYQDSDFAMSQPAFAPNREIWYSDGATGFYDVRVAANVWPQAATSSGAAAPLPASCKGLQRFAIKLPLPAGIARGGLRVTVNGKRLAMHLHRRARYGSAVADLRRTGTVLRLVARVRLRNGRNVTLRRTYRPCAKR
jgi:hypothetical protein